MINNENVSQHMQKGFDTLSTYLPKVPTYLYQVTFIIRMINDEFILYGYLITYTLTLQLSTGNYVSCIILFTRKISSK